MGHNEPRVVVYPKFGWVGHNAIFPCIFDISSKYKYLNRRQSIVIVFLAQLAELIV